MKTHHNTVYKLWLGLCPFGKSMDFPKPVYIWRGSCQNTPQLIYINVSGQLKKITFCNEN